MRHRVKRANLPKTKSKGKADMRNLVTALFKHESIKTTKRRAKSLSAVAEKLITAVTKKSDREAIRALQGIITEKEVATKIIKELKPKFDKSQSGYISTYKLGPRGGDAAEMVKIQLNLN